MIDEEGGELSNFDLATWRLSLISAGHIRPARPMPGRADARPDMRQEPGARSQRTRQ